MIITLYILCENNASKLERKISSVYDVVYKDVVIVFIIRIIRKISMNITKRTE